MCLAVPMKIVEIADGTGGVADVDGTRYTVDLSLLDGAKIGDYVIVHAGFAIESLDQEEADARLKLFGEMADMYRESGGETGGKGQ